MKSISLALVLILAFAACSTTKQLASPDDAQRKIGSGSATVQLRSGECYDVRQMQFSWDSVTWVNRETDSLLQIAGQDIESIRISHHIPGAVEGAMFGTMGGVALGYLRGIRWHWGGDEGMGKGLAILGGMVIGGVTGLVIGAIKGHDYTFIMPEDSGTTQHTVSDSLKVEHP